MVTTLNTSPALKISKGRLWTARIMGGIVIAFMLMDSIFKFIPNEEAITATTDLGYQAHHLPILGALGLTTILLFAIPRTQILGAVLLSGRHRSPSDRSGTPVLTAYAQALFPMVTQRAAPGATV